MERVGYHRHYCSDCDAYYTCRIQYEPCYLENAEVCLQHYLERFALGIYLQ